MRRSETEHYGSGSPHAFVLHEDEAIGALKNAERIVNAPNSFIAQFLRPEPPKPLAFEPNIPPKDNAWIRITIQALTGRWSRCFHLSLR
jgi:hypothetical protein